MLCIQVNTCTVPLRYTLTAQMRFIRTNAYGYTHIRVWLYTHAHIVIRTYAYDYTHIHIYLYAYIRLYISIWCLFVIQDENFSLCFIVVKKKELMSIKRDELSSVLFSTNRSFKQWNTHSKAKELFIKVSRACCSRLVILSSRKSCVSAHVRKSLAKCLLSEAFRRMISLGYPKKVLQVLQAMPPVFNV